MPFSEIDECDLAELCRLLPDRLLEAITQALAKNPVLSVVVPPKISVHDVWDWNANVTCGTSLVIAYTGLHSHAEVRVVSNVVAKLVSGAVDTWYDNGRPRGSYIAETLVTYGDRIAGRNSLKCLFWLKLPEQN